MQYIYVRIYESIQEDYFKGTKLARRTAMIHLLTTSLSEEKIITKILTTCEFFLLKDKFLLQKSYSVLGTTAIILLPTTPLNPITRFKQNNI